MSVKPVPPVRNIPNYPPTKQDKNKPIPEKDRKKDIDSFDSMLENELKKGNHFSKYASINDLTKQANEDVSVLYSNGYAGLKSSGGFSTDSEYEVGIGRLLEAYHCLAGDAVKGLSSEYFPDHSFSHMRLELSRIADIMEEYCRPIYLYQLGAGSLETRRYQYPSEVINKSINDIKNRIPKLREYTITNFESLKNEIPKLEGAIKNKFSIPIIYKAYENTLNFLRALERSFPFSDKNVFNNMLVEVNNNELKQLIDEAEIFAAECIKAEENKVTQNSEVQNTEVEPIIAEPIIKEEEPIKEGSFNRIKSLESLIKTAHNVFTEDLSEEELNKGVEIEHEHKDTITKIYNTLADRNPTEEELEDAYIGITLDHEDETPALDYYTGENGLENMEEKLHKEDGDNKMENKKEFKGKLSLDELIKSKVKVGEFPSQEQVQQNIPAEAPPMETSPITEEAPPMDGVDETAQPQDNTTQINKYFIEAKQFLGMIKGIIETKIPKEDLDQQELLKAVVTVENLIGKIVMATRPDAVENV